MDYDEYNYDYGEEEEEAEDEKIDYDLEDIMVETPPVTFNRLKSQSSMMFLRLDDIKSILDRRIKELQELLDATYDEILILFHYFHWNRDKLENSDWFTNQEEISRKAGLIPLDNNIPSDPNLHECPVCLGELSTEEMESLKCGHKICHCCWEAFINDNVNCKDNEFFWKCPGQNNGKNCNLVVPDSFNRKYLKKENETKYIRKLCRSYVEENKAVRWCPAPNCTYGVENPSLTSRTIRCKCSTLFCFKCGLEDHHPCGCDVASNWNSKNIQESENTKWITIYTKMCPKCNRPIEKHQGCNHMTCKHKGCDFEFCWLCLDDWKTHQGSHYKCNKYEALNQEEKDNMNSKYDKEKSDLEKYVFYFERFSNNERAFQIAKEINHKMEHNVDDLRTKLNLPFTEINFLTDATDMLQKARKILKWSYVFAYYISNQKTKDLFEFHQKDLERYCEELNEALEMNYSKSVQINQGVLDLKAFLSYKDKVSNFNYRCQKFTNEISKIIEEGTVEKI